VTLRVRGLALLLGIATLIPPAEALAEVSVSREGDGAGRLRGDDAADAIAVGVDDNQDLTWAANGSVPSADWDPGAEGSQTLPADGTAFITVEAAGGDDRFEVSGRLPVAIVASGGSGGDVLSGSVLSDVLGGGGGKDVVLGGDGLDELKGGGGRDALAGGHGNDFIEGGPRDDEIAAGSGRDGLEGDAGDDLLEGGSAPDQLQGGAGSDELRGGPGRGDDLEGNAGRDALAGGGGERDRCDGGPGRDRRTPTCERVERIP
jgi:Ca2+-binding RTX toxin-like protein